MSKLFTKINLWWKDREAKKRRNTFIENHGATHACPNCNKWEHEGNTIYTEIYDSVTDKRTCTNCGYIWRSHFCPAGHAWLEDWEWDEGKNKFVIKWKD